MQNWKLKLSAAATAVCALVALAINVSAPKKITLIGTLSTRVTNGGTLLVVKDAKGEQKLMALGNTPELVDTILPNRLSIIVGVENNEGLPIVTSISCNQW